MIEELRIKEWLDKFLLVLFCSFLIIPEFNINSIGFIFLFIVYLAVVEQYIYLLNSYCDKDTKIFSQRITKNLIILLGLFSLILPLFTLNIVTILLGLITFFLATFYSAKPLRFKARGILGLSGAFAQYVMPFLLFYSLFPGKTMLTVFLITYLAILAIVKLLIHQVYDYEEDKKLKIKTMITPIGKKAGLSITYFFIMLLFFAYPALFFLFQIFEATIILITLIIFSTPSFLYIMKVIKHEA